MRVALKLPMFVLGLTVLWVALWDDISLANVVGGVLVGIFVIAVSHLEPAERPGVHLHPWLTIWYVIRLGLKLVESNLKLAWEILTPGIGTHTGIIAVPMRCTSDGVVTTIANSITLTPGTLSVEVERDGDDVTLYVHGMYTRNLEQVRHEMFQLEALAIRAFGTDEEAEMAVRQLSEHVVPDVDDGPDGGGS